MASLKKQLVTIAQSLRKLNVTIDVNEVGVYGVPWWQSSSFHVNQYGYYMYIREGGDEDTLVHELGHYIVSKYELENNRLYLRYFADEDENEDHYNYRVMWFGVLRYLGFESWGVPSMYAYVNGEEEFCELLVALYQHNWKPVDDYDDDEVIHKMKVVRKILKQI